MNRWIGLLGSWALFVLGLGLASISVAGEWINVKDSQKLQRYVAIEKLLGERVAGRSQELRQARKSSESSLNSVRSRMTTASRLIERTERKGRISGAVIPADAYYVEMARRNGMNVVRLNPGQSIDADTGRAALKTGGGVWDWFGESAGSRRVLTVENNTVVETSEGVKRELPSGALIHAGETIVIPPVGTPQRKFEGDLPATDTALQGEEIAQSAKPPKIRVTRLLERGESIFGGH